MAKTANYFPHDANMRNTSPVLRLRMKHGLEGYGAYCMILERLRSEQDYTSVKDYNMIAFDLRCSAELVKSVVEDFGLFDFADDGERIYSEDLTDWMEPLDSVKEARSAAASKRWSKAKGASSSSDEDAKEMQGSCKASALHMHGTSDADAIRIDKIKEKEIKKEEKRGDEGGSPPPPPPDEKDVFVLADALEAMKEDDEWLASVANVTDTDPRMLPALLDAFADYAKSRGKVYPDIGEAMGHFTNWIPTKSGQKAMQRVRRRISEVSRPRTDDTAAEDSAPAVKPADMIRRWGYDPEKVTLAQAMSPAWREKNPPAL